MKYVGYIWAFPVTLFGAIYVLLFTLFGWYKFVGIRNVAFVFSVTDRSPRWLLNLWQGWYGHTVGNVIIMFSDDDTALSRHTLIHELEHTRQCMLLGPFQPILYGLFMLVIWIALPMISPYWMNPFEIAARKSANEKIDIK